MGRQPFLTRLGLGRSPFEPSTSPSRSAEYVQLDSSQHDIPLEARAPNSNRYIQLFDERGNPINPRAQQHGRQFRRAQNDVLSAIGFLQRRRSSSQDLPGPYEERLSLLEREQLFGKVISHVSIPMRYISTWWLASIKDRLLLFPDQAILPLSQAITSEYQTSVRPLFYSGLVSRCVPECVIRIAIVGIIVFQPMDRFINAMEAAPKTRRFIRRWRNDIISGLFGCAKVLLFPFTYHARLQRLGLTPSRQWLPSWRSLIPFSAASPLWAFLPGQNLSDLTIFQILTSVVLSPVFLICLTNEVERMLYRRIHDAIETSVLRPDNPDMVFHDPSSRRTSPTPSALQKIISKVMAVIGWGKPIRKEDATESQPPDVQPVDAQQTGNDGDSTAIDTNRIEPSTRTVTGTQESDTGWPLSPTVSNTSHDANDPRIRITSRGGIVEMEVQLPSRVISSYAETMESSPDSGNFGPLPSATQRPQTFHRVTALSNRPAASLSAMLSVHLVELVLLPLKFLTVRSIATYSLAGPRPLSTSPVFPNEWNLGSFCIFMSRLGMCGALELAIHLGVWGLEWVAVTQSGRMLFGYGDL